MTIEEAYNFANLLSSFAEKNGLTTSISALRTQINSLKIWRTNPNSTNIAQAILQSRNTLNLLRNSVLTAIDSTVNDLKISGQYNEVFDTILGGIAYNQISSLDKNVDINGNLFETIDQTLTNIQSIFDFDTAAKKSFLKFQIHSAVLLDRDKLNIVYENDAFIDDLKGLAKATDDWYFIVHSFGRLVNENNTKAEVLSVVRGSLIITIGVITGIITAITKSSNLIMDSVLKALSIKQKILELRKLVNENDSAELDLLEKKATIKMNTLASQITTKLMDEYQNKPTAENHKEIEGFIKKSVKKMIEFNSKGGKVEPKFLSGSTEEHLDAVELSNKNKEFNNIQNTINQVENGKYTLLLEENIEENDSKENSKD